MDGAETPGSQPVYSLSIAGGMSGFRADVAGGIRNQNHSLRIETYAYPEIISICDLFVVMDRQGLFCYDLRLQNQLA